VPPEKLKMGSTWQMGPSWLVYDRSEWPVSPLQYDRKLEEKISEFCLKSRRAAPSNITKTYTFVSGKKKSTMAFKGDMDDYGMDELIVRCGNLGKLVRSVAYFLRVAGKALRKNSERVYGKEISASEFNDALMWLVAWEQKKRLRKEEIIRLAPVEIDYYLENYNFKVKLTIVGGRIKNFSV